MVGSSVGGQLASSKDAQWLKIQYDKNHKGRSRRGIFSSINVIFLRLIGGGGDHQPMADRLTAI